MGIHRPTYSSRGSSSNFIIFKGAIIQSKTKIESKYCIRGMRMHYAVMFKKSTTIMNLLLLSCTLLI